MIPTRQIAQQVPNAVTQHQHQKAFAFALALFLGGLMFLALMSGAKADQIAQSVTGQITIEWKEPSKIRISPAELPSGNTISPYRSIALRADGGSGPYIFFVSKGVLPLGLILHPSTGILSGGAVQSGVFPITVEARDARQQAGSKEYRISIAASQAPPTFAPPLPPQNTGGGCPQGQVRFGANCVAGNAPVAPPTFQPPPIAPNPPTLAQQPRPPQQPAGNLVTQLQKQLIRLGCLRRGQADGQWGSGSRAGLVRFVKRAGLRINSSQPSQAALRAARRTTNQICATTAAPNRCPPNSRLGKSQCTCLQGFEARGGRCVRKRVKTNKKRCPQGTYRKAGECVPQRFNCPTNASVINGRCTCDRGYKEKKGRCARVRKKIQQPRQEPRCTIRNSYYDRAKKGCVCKRGYQAQGTTKCVRISKKSQPARCTGGAFRGSNGRCRCEGSVQVYRNGKCVRPSQKKKRKGKYTFQQCKSKCTRKLLKCAKKYKGNPNIKNICINKVTKCAYKYGCPGAL